MRVFWGTARRGCTSSRGTWPMGVPLISRMRSPTWMEFFMSGLMQSGSTLQTAGAQCVLPTPSRVGMCWDTAHEPPPQPMGTGCRVPCESPLPDGDVLSWYPRVTPAMRGHTAHRSPGPCKLPTCHLLAADRQASCPRWTGTCKLSLLDGDTQSWYPRVTPLCWGLVDLVPTGHPC